MVLRVEIDRIYALGHKNKSKIGVTVFLILGKLQKSGPATKRGGRG